MIVHRFGDIDNFCWKLNKHISENKTKTYIQRLLYSLKKLLKLINLPCMRWFFSRVGGCPRTSWHIAMHFSSVSQEILHTCTQKTVIE